MYHETVPILSSKCRPNMVNLGCVSSSERNYHNYGK